MSAATARDPFEVADLPQARAESALADDRASFPLESWIGRVLLAVALLAVLVCDVRLIGDQANYQPDNEANRVAFVQHVADHGTPPTLGKDSFMIEPTGAVPPHTTVLRRLVQGQSGSVSVNTLYPQSFGLERPYVYYLAAPVALVVPWSHRILALRLLCLLAALAGLIFLWAAVREAWPANPVAAGLAAIVLGTMPGLMEAFSAFNPGAFLFASWCAGLWLVLRDVRRRTCSGWTIAVCTLATCASSSAVLGALLAVGVVSWRARASFGRTAARLGVVLVPSIVWGIWNQHAYGDAWPLNKPVLGGPDRPRNWHALTTWIDNVYNISASIFDQFYASGVVPARHLDTRPETLIPVLFVLAIGWVLLSGQIARARMPLARLGALMFASFACIYLASFIASVFAAAPMDYSEATFGGYGAAWAGAAGIGLSAPLVGHRRVTVVATALFALVFVAIMLRAPAL